MSMSMSMSNAKKKKKMVVKVKRQKLEACMKCPLCRKLFKEATTISLCLHTFCRKCIYEKLSDEEMEFCPVCNIDLGCLPVEKLRPDHNLQDIRAIVFPFERRKIEVQEVVPSISSPAKRKKRSLSSFVASAPKVSTDTGFTGKRIKTGKRKAAAFDVAAQPSLSTPTVEHLLNGILLRVTEMGLIMKQQWNSSERARGVDMMEQLKTELEGQSRGFNDELGLLRTEKAFLSLWDSRFQGHEFVEKHPALTDDAGKFHTLGAEQTCHAIIKQHSLRSANLGEAMVEGPSAFEKSRTAMEGELRRLERYDEEMEGMKQKIFQTEEDKKKEIDKMKAQMEEDIRKERALATEAQEEVKKEDKVSKLTDEVTKLGEVVSRKEDEVSKLNDEITKLGKVVLKKEDEVSKLTDEVTKLGEVVSRKEDEVSKLNDEITKLGKVVLKKEDEVSKLNDEITKHGEEVSSLKEDDMDVQISQFKAGYDQALEHIVFLQPNFDISSMAPFNKIEGDKLVDPFKDEDEDEEEEREVQPRMAR